MSEFAFLNQEVLERIANHCPSAMSTYLMCLNHIDKNNFCFFSKEVLNIDKSLSFTVFKNNLKKLSRENLLEWHLINDGIAVTLAENYE